MNKQRHPLFKVCSREKYTLQIDLLNGPDNFMIQNLFVLTDQKSSSLDSSSKIIKKIFKDQLVYVHIHNYKIRLDKIRLDKIRWYKIR